MSNPALANSYENARPEIQALVPIAARRILDLGCSSGTVGAALKARQGAEVVGVEIDAGYAARAQTRLDRVLCVDVETLASGGKLEQQLGRFDCLIAGDVLEHLREPWDVLRTMAELLDTDGTAVISLPNIRFWETFWVLGRHGTWPRRDEGIFDRTHLRFFTASDAIGLLREAELEMIEIRREYRLSGAQPSRWDPHVRRLGRTPLRPLFVYQHVISARPTGR